MTTERILLLLLAGAALIAWFVYLFIPVSSGQNDLRLQSIGRLQNIGLAIRDYQADHGGRLPGSFSDLIPQYVPLKQIFLFYPSTNQTQTRAGETNVVVEAVDHCSPYIYLGTNATNFGIIALERPRLWQAIKSSDWMRDHVAVLHSDFRVELISTGALPSAVIEAASLRVKTKPAP